MRNKRKERERGRKEFRDVLDQINKCIKDKEEMSQAPRMLQKKIEKINI